MDADGKMEHDIDGKGCYKVELNDEEGNQEIFKFKDVGLAPPTGVSGENYARYDIFKLLVIRLITKLDMFSFIHRKSQPHQWAISWTTSRFNENLSPTDKPLGGHFFIAQYGIRIQAAANTIIAWHPRNWHSTSLHANCGTN